MRGIQIGQLLVEQGALSQQQVAHILAAQRTSYRPFGDLAERLYGVSSDAIEDAWVEQYIREAGMVDLGQIDFDADCLRALNRRQAWQFHMLPASREAGMMNVATDRDSLVRSINFATNWINEPVSFVIAERPQLREFLMRHYPVPQQMADFADKF